MKKPGRILVVDDLPQNVKLLADLLTVKGYEVTTAASGEEALEKIEADPPDLVLLDIMMPGIDGYGVCRKIRDNPATEILPVAMVTSLDPSQERIKGLEAGADDFISKPVDQPALLARVRSLLRIKELYDTVQDQAAKLSEWNHTLEAKVQEQVAELENLSQLKRFLAPQVANLILSGDAEDPLRTHRREVTVVFLDLRGFTAFAETAEPEEVMSVLQDYHAEMGAYIMEYQGTIEHFAGDGIMVIFNDPVELPNPAENAVRMALAMRGRIVDLKASWRKLGYDLDCGFGVAKGYATIGAIGFEGRRDYSAIGSVINLASRLCDQALGGQILVSGKALTTIEDIVEAEALEPFQLKGFTRPVQAYNIVRTKA
jgi:class 3 adenylate cyclase/CheY-like chemotaxis protein